MKAIYWRLFIVRLALRWISKPNLGDEVIYQGRRWVLSQGVRDPIWSLVSGDDYIEVHRDQFRKVPGVHAAWQSFRSGYRFYMTSWYSIWKREGVQPWMRGCQIWGRRSAEMNTKASAWFSDAKEFRQLCGDAQSQARQEGAQEFAAQMMLAANQHGLDTYLSIKQLEWLCRIADWEVPKRVAHS